MKNKAHTSLRLVGLTTALLLVLGIASFAVSPVAFADKPSSVPPASHPDPKGKAKGHNPLIPVNAILNITATGPAVNITDPSMTASARVTFKATVVKSSVGGAKLDVTEGKLTIGTTDYTIVKGKGRIALHSGKIIVHLLVTAPDGSKLHVVLRGKSTDIPPFPTSFPENTVVDVHFTKPQSKLASKFFLDLSGTLKRVTP